MRQEKIHFQNADGAQLGALLNWPEDEEPAASLFAHCFTGVRCDETESKIDRFEREVELTGALDEEQCRRLLEIAEKCPVHRTLAGEPVIETRLREKGRPSAEEM